MQLREFLSHSKISAKVFAEACDINFFTFRNYLYRGVIPTADNALKIILQSGHNITLEDLAGEINWKPKEKIKTMRSTVVKGKTSKMKKHERKIYYRDVDNI